MDAFEGIERDGYIDQRSEWFASKKSVWGKIEIFGKGQANEPFEFDI